MSLSYFATFSPVNLENSNPKFLFEFLKKGHFKVDMVRPTKATSWGTWDLDGSDEVRRHDSMEDAWTDFTSIDVSGSIGCQLSLNTPETESCRRGESSLKLFPTGSQLHAVFLISSRPCIDGLADRLRLTKSSYLDFLVAISLGLGAKSFAADACEKTLEELRNGEVKPESVDNLTAVFGIHESAISELIDKWTPQTMGPKVSRMKMFSTEAGQVACSPELAKVPRDGIVG